MTTKSEGMMIPGKLKWYVILALALWLAFSDVAAAEQLYVNESGWWRDGGAFNANGTPIQAAVDAADAGDAIYVEGGNYNENVNVDKSLTLEGEGADVVTVRAASVEARIFNVTADYVNISGFTVTGANDLFKVVICGGGGGGGGGAPGPEIYRMAGVYLGSGVDHCNISDNTVSENEFGIYLRPSSSSNSLTDNNVSNNYHHGIYLSSSSNNTLTGNIMSGNSHNFGIHGYSLSHFIQNIDTSNKVDGKPIYYWVGQQDKQIPSDAGFVGIVNSINITVSDLTLANNSMGVLFVHTSNSRIENVTVSSNNYHHGIYLFFSSNNTITGNTLRNNTASGILCGIYLMDSSNNTLTNNTASGNGDGIRLWHSSNNTLRNNTANSNDWHGIVLYSSSNNNTLTNNIANSNDYYGVRLWGCSNTLRNNTFINNGFCVGEGSCRNTVENNTVNGKPLVYLEDIFNFAIQNAGQVILVNCANITVENLNLSNASVGIELLETNGCGIVNNIISNNKYGIFLYSSSDNNVSCNWVQSNTERGFYLTGGSTGNNISCNNVIENGNYNATNGGWEWQFYIDQYNPVEAKHNYWGAGMNNSTIDASIHEWDGEVEFYPFETEPVPCAPTPEEPPAFTTADAVIALQIAAGSRPYDATLDVSGDGSVTSLDALMILQAAGGCIEIG